MEKINGSLPSQIFKVNYELGMRFYDAFSRDALIEMLQTVTDTVCHEIILIGSLST